MRIQAISVSPLNPLLDQETGQVIEERQLVEFILADNDVVARKWKAITPILSGSELQSYLDEKAAEYLSLILVHELKTGDSLAYTKTEHLERMNAAVVSKIGSKYDDGTKIMFQAIALVSVIEALIAAEILPPDFMENLPMSRVLVWAKSVMEYYYGKVNEVSTGQTSDWAFVTYDFDQFDATDPGVSLPGLLQPS